MSVFQSDADLAEEQKKAARLPKGASQNAWEERAERMEHARELREHRRWRHFAFLLFIVPAVFSLLSIVIGFVVAHLFASHADSFVR